MYVNFFIRVKDIFVPVGSFSRSSNIFGAISDSLPWEKVRPISGIDLHNFKQSLIHIQSEWEEELRGYEDELRFIEKSESPLSERVDMRRTISNEMDGLKEDLDWLRSDIDYFNFLDRLRDEIRYDQNFKDINLEKYIYAGIECGFPTKDDIEE
jgi:hypothetical protein